MNLSYFISKRIIRDQKKGFASSIHTIAIVIVGVGLAAVIISFLIMRGFQETVKNKIYSFNGHLMVSKYTMNYSGNADFSRSRRILKKVNNDLIAYFYLQFVCNNSADHLASSLVWAWRQPFCTSCNLDLRAPCCTLFADTHLLGTSTSK